MVRCRRIEVREFGSFLLTRRAPRIGLNLRNGAQVTIPENHVPHFKVGKALRMAVDARADEMIRPAW